MANPTPAEVFGPGFTEDTTDKTITFQYASNTNPAFDLTEIFTTDVSASNGDARTLVYALLERISDWYEGLDALDRPENFRISRSGTLNDANGEIFIRRNYSIECRAQAGALILIDEV